MSIYTYEVVNEQWQAKEAVETENRKELKPLQQLLNQCYQPICRVGHNIGTASGERLSALPLRNTISLNLNKGAFIGMPLLFNMVGLSLVLTCQWNMPCLAPKVGYQPSDT